MRKMNKKTTVLIALLLSGVAELLTAQAARAGQPEIVPISRSKSTPVPKYLAYRYFLSWANNLNAKAIAAGESDPYRFAASFQRAGLETRDLDAVLKEAKALDLELAKQRERIAVLVAEYRRVAGNREPGSALPPIPPEIHELEAMRTAVLVHHMVNLQSSLGPQKTAQLEAYFEHEFIPHISLKPLGRPPASANFGNPTHSFSTGQQ
jgi:hypothetical protein